MIFIDINLIVREKERAEKAVHKNVLILMIKYQNLFSKKVKLHDKLYVLILINIIIILSAGRPLLGIGFPIDFQKDPIINKVSYLVSSKNKTVKQFLTRKHFFITLLDARIVYNFSLKPVGKHGA